MATYAAPAALSVAEGHEALYRTDFTRFCLVKRFPIRNIKRSKITPDFQNLAANFTVWQRCANLETKVAAGYGPPFLRRQKNGAFVANKVLHLFRLRYSAAEEPLLLH